MIAQRLLSQYGEQTTMVLRHRVAEHQEAGELEAAQFWQDVAEAAAIWQSSGK